MALAEALFDAESGQDDTPMLGTWSAQRGQAHEVRLEAAPRRGWRGPAVAAVLLTAAAAAWLAASATRHTRQASIRPEGVQEAFGVDSPAPGSSFFFQDTQVLPALTVPSAGASTSSDGVVLQSDEASPVASTTPSSNVDAVGAADQSEEELPPLLGLPTLPTMDSGSALAPPQDAASSWPESGAQEATAAPPALSASNGMELPGQDWAGTLDAPPAAGLLPEEGLPEAGLPTPVASSADSQVPLLPPLPPLPADAVPPATDGFGGNTQPVSVEAPVAQTEEAFLPAPSDADAFGALTTNPEAETAPAAALAVAPLAAAGDALPPDASALTPELTEDQLDLQGTAITSTTTGPACLIEDETNYPGNDVVQIQNVTSPEECCSRCSGNAMCSAWTWGKKRGAAFSDVCFLKGTHPRAWVTKLRDADFVSGKPVQAKRAITLQWPKAGRSLFCFSLMLPRSYEQQLLQLQFMKGASIFDCDEYAIYSNESIEVMPGLSTRVVHSSLSCSVGGEFRTALNTDIFMEVWKKVVSDGRFMFHDWTVKVDPDCVFFPGRLQHILANHSEDNSGTYLNNCWRGLHGPIEVFSRNAVQAWGAFSDLCVQYFTKLCSGPCLWGEDMFIDQCLQKVLKVRRDDEFQLLVEDHCDPTPGWKDCTNQSVAAFHPFKTIDGYWLCLNNAQKKK